MTTTTTTPQQQGMDVAWASIFPQVLHASTGVVDHAGSSEPRHTHIASHATPRGWIQRKRTHTHAERERHAGGSTMDLEACRMEGARQTPPACDPPVGEKGFQQGWQEGTRRDTHTHTHDEHHPLSTPVTPPTLRLCGENDKKEGWTKFFPQTAALVPTCTLPRCEGSWNFTWIWDPGMDSSGSDLQGP